MITPSLSDDCSTIIKPTPNCALEAYKNQFVIHKFFIWSWDRIIDLSMNAHNTSIAPISSFKQPDKNLQNVVFGWPCEV